MPNDEFPNRCRADSALTIYRDELRQYIALVLEEEYGATWFKTQVLPLAPTKSIAKKLQKDLDTHMSPEDLIDLRDIPILIKDNASLFDPPPQENDHRRTELIRLLRNELQHANQSGDCTPGDASEIAILCAAVLEHLDLIDAAERIRNL